MLLYIAVSRLSDMLEKVVELFLFLRSFRCPNSVMPALFQRCQVLLVTAFIAKYFVQK